MINGRQNKRQRRLFRRLIRRNTRCLLACVSLALVATFRLSISNSQRIKLLVVILTAQRPESFSRLFRSLLRAQYGGMVVDMLIHVDGVDEDHSLRERTVEFAQSKVWPHGEKIVTIEKEKIGLRRSWLRASPRRAHTRRYF